MLAVRTRSTALALTLAWGAASPFARAQPLAVPLDAVPTHAPPPQPSDGIDLQAGLRGEGATLSVAEAADRARRASPELSIARAAVARSQAVADQSFVAIYPRLELEARYTRLADTGGIINPALLDGVEASLPGATIDAGVFQRILNNYLLQARVTYPVSDIFTRALPRYRAAQKQAHFERLRSRAGVFDAEIAAKEAYYAYARTRAVVVVARASLVEAEAQQRDVTAMVEAGGLALVERLRAEARVSAAQVGIAQAESQMEIAKTALLTLMGQADKGELGIADDLLSPLPPLPTARAELVERALQTRSEVLALRELMLAHVYRIDAEQGARWPSLGVGGSAELENPNPRWANNDQRFRGSWSVFASLTWSPNDIASGGYGADQFRADLARTQADLGALENALRNEVARAYQTYDAARSAMVAASAGIRAASESYRVRREQFQAGAAVATDVVQAENELRAARLDRIDAAIDGRLAAARLARAVEGQIFPP